MAEAAADADLCDAAVCIAQLIGGLGQPVEGQIFQRRLACDFLKATEAFCPADIYLPGHILHRYVFSVMAFYKLQYPLHPLLIFSVCRFSA